MKNLVKTVLGVALLNLGSCDKMKTLNEPEFEKDILGDLSKNIYLQFHGSDLKLLEIKDKNTIILKSGVSLFDYYGTFTYKIDRISPNQDTLYLKNEKTKLKIYYNGKKNEVIYEGQKSKSPIYEYFKTQDEYFNGTKEEKEF